MGGNSGTRCTHFGEMTPKEIRFCEEYVKDWNATQAVLRAGIVDGTKKNVANTAGYKLLQKQHVKDYIQNLMNIMTKQCQTNVDDLMQFWTQVMLDPNESTNNRLKASDYLGKALGAFTVKVETNQAPTIIMDLGLPPASPEPLALEPAVELIMEDDDDESDTD